MAQENKKSIAFFDVDYTLVNGNTGFFASLYLIHYGILKGRRLAQALYFTTAYKFFEQDIEKIYQLAVTDLKGVSLKQLLEIGKECLEKQVIRRIYKQGLQLIKEHQKKGDLVILLTSSPYMMIKNLADYLGVDDAYCTGPKVIDGIMTNSLQTPICYGEGKIHYAEIACKKYGIKLKDCSFYSDNKSDIPLLSLVGRPVAVNPDHTLKRISRKNKWPILNFKGTGKN